MREEAKYLKHGIVWPLIDGSYPSPSLIRNVEDGFTSPRGNFSTFSVYIVSRFHLDLDGSLVTSRGDNVSHPASANHESSRGSRRGSTNQRVLFFFRHWSFGRDHADAEIVRAASASQLRCALRFRRRALRRQRCPHRGGQSELPLGSLEFNGVRVHLPDAGRDEPNFVHAGTVTTDEAVVVPVHRRVGRGLHLLRRHESDRRSLAPSIRRFGRLVVGMPLCHRRLPRMVPTPVEHSSEWNPVVSDTAATGR